MQLTLWKKKKKSLNIKLGLDIHEMLVWASTPHPKIFQSGLQNFLCFDEHLYIRNDGRI